MSRRIRAALAAVSFALLSLPSAVSMAASGYTLTDLTRAAAHASGRTVLSAQEVRKLDFNADGDISLSDLIRIARQCQAPVNLSAEETNSNSYPGADAALAAARAYIPDAVHAEILSCMPVPDTDGAEYEVRALSHGGTYTITVHAADGSVRHRSMEREPDPVYSGPSISLDDAKASVVLRIPGTSASDISSARRTQVQGAPAFEVHVQTDAENVWATLMEDTGEIVRWSEDLIPDDPDTPPVLGTTPPSTEGLISEEQAIIIALRKVPDAASSDVVSCGLNTNTLPAVYTVDIVYDDASYMFQVGAYDGAVLTERMEREPHADLPSSPLNEDSAMQALLDRASGIKVEYPSVYARETEHGTVFDVHVDMDSASTYDATFCARTGELLFWEVEKAVSHGVPDPIREIVPPR